MPNWCPMSQNLHGHWGSTPLHVLHEGQPVASLAACYAPPATTGPWLQQQQQQPPVFAHYGVVMQQPHPFMQGGMYPPQPYYTAFHGQPVMMMAGGVFGSRPASGGGMVVAGHSQSLPSTPKNGRKHPARSMLTPTRCAKLAPSSPHLPNHHGPNPRVIFPDDLPPLTKQTQRGKCIVQGGSEGPIPFSKGFRAGQDRSHSVAISRCGGLLLLLLFIICGETKDLTGSSSSSSC